eukprot:TRINITY_DN2969_c0_g1_i4.p1 TRINITY_DN2969_c0_g1~~TRINITY_DN2969_c0_g1_i4.p1  ORF type:complete len:916 (-),score=225.94 TRINITY_DN2969_c0_g1_i4:1099-3846(-)
MIKRSLNTYMNAWTASDHTSYPFSTQNKKDFTNLMSVYLDATFFPRLNKLDFMQEGHRFEFKIPDDPNSPLGYQGVVYNEMKGAMSEPGSIFMYKLNEKMFPTDTYRFNSGGDPQNIPELSYEQLKEFHSRHYHPSNSRFYTYGDLPLEEHLKFINENVLSRFQRIDPKTDIQSEEKWDTPRRFTTTGPPATMIMNPQKQTKMLISFLTNPISDIKMVNSLVILSTLLLDGPNSPMHKVLIESNIGSDWAPGTGYSPYGKEASFGFGLQDISHEDVTMVEQIIWDTLKKASEEGFTKERIDSVLHQIEMSQKTVTTRFGMTTLQGISSTWIHGGDIVESLRVDEYVNWLRDQLSQGPFFQNLIKKYLLDNPHHLTFVMTPDPNYSKNIDVKERKKLDEIQKNLDEEEKDAIVEWSKKLKVHQESKKDDNVSCLPTLDVDVDVPRTFQKDYSFDIESEPRVKHGITWNNQPTNGILYFRAMLNIPNLSEELLLYLPLFVSIITQLGTENISHRDLSSKIELNTGGINFEIVQDVDHFDLNKSKGKLLISSNCLERNIASMFDILKEVMNGPNFLEEKLLMTNLIQRATDAQDAIVGEGHTFGRLYASSSFHRSAYLSEQFSGFHQVSFLQQIANDQNITFTISKLKELCNELLRQPLEKILITGEEKTFPKVKESLFNFIGSLPSSPSVDSNIGDPKQIQKQTKDFFRVLGSMNFVTKCLPTVAWAHDDSMKLALLSQVLSQGPLHSEIREKGGAYGAGASSNSGIWAFYSYRDPHTTRTLDIFNNVNSYVDSDRFNDSLIKEMKLSLFGSIDQPTPPSQKGLLEWARGITREMRQKKRDQLFEIGKQDLVEVANKYLKENQKSSFAIFGLDQEFHPEKNENEEEFYQKKYEGWNFHSIGNSNASEDHLGEEEEEE